MSDWALKRFWAEVRTVPVSGGWSVELDGRPIRTPGRDALTLPTPALADAIAAEWSAQEGNVRPESMPCTRAANSAIDKVTAKAAGVADLLLGYGETDLICYRAESPEELTQLQAQAWDPLLDWARSALGAPLVVTAGIVPVPQPRSALGALRARLEEQDAFAMTALHDLVTLSGSLIIGLAAQGGVLADEELWIRSRVDEDWQERQWGRDAEAAEAASARRDAFLQAARFHRLSRPSA
ncbi:MAG: ATP12 family protein [Pseudomonadota bacterium]